MSLELFPEDSSQNLLPKDGTVHYFGKVLNSKVADEFFLYLMNEIDWKCDEAVIFGKRIETKRKVAWYGEKPFQYRYSGTTKVALPFTDELLRLKILCETLTEEEYNSCLLNLYHNGTEGMAYHSDGEKDLKKDGAIASLSLGAERKFSFKHKISKEKVYLLLEHGSLMVMKNETQSFWLHRLPPTKKVNSPRISLTFRTIVD